MLTPYQGELRGLPPASGGPGSYCRLAQGRRMALVPSWGSGHLYPAGVQKGTSGTEKGVPQDQAAFNRLWQRPPDMCPRQGCQFGPRDWV